MRNTPSFKRCLNKRTKSLFVLNKDIEQYTSIPDALSVLSLNHDEAVVTPIERP
jgi:hypothetical protein